MLASQPTSSRDIPGRRREYETVYILRPDIDDATVSAVNTKVRKVMEDNGGTVLKIENWGKRRLAYTVQKQTRGTYLFWRYLGSPGLVEEVERNLKLTDSVIRLYTVKLAENVDPKSRASEFTEEAFAQAGVAGPELEPEPLEATGGLPQDDDDGDVIPSGPETAPAREKSEE